MKGVIKIRKLKKDRQHNDHKKKDKKDKQQFSKHIHKTKDRLVNTNANLKPGMNSCAPEWRQFLFHHWHPSR
jgi:hypothetical protein